MNILSDPLTDPLTDSLDVPSAFAAIALSAVAWDGVLTMAGSRALRHALDYRHPYAAFADGAMVGILDHLLAQMRSKGAQHLMVDAARVLNPNQRATAYAMAVEIMRSDGPLLEDECNILDNLAYVLGLKPDLTANVQFVMDLLHADLDATSCSIDHLAGDHESSAGLEALS